MHDARQYLMRLLEFEELSYCREICHYEQMLACIITLRPLLFFWKWPHASEAHNQRRTNERTRLGREARESNVWNRVRECRGLRRTRGKKSPFRQRMTFSVTPGSFRDDERMGPAPGKNGAHMAGTLEGVRRTDAADECGSASRTTLQKLQTKVE